MNCKGCLERTLGCHDRCLIYKKFKEEKEKIRERREKEWEYKDYKNKSISKRVFKKK